MKSDWYKAKESSRKSDRYTNIINWFLKKNIDKQLKKSNHHLKWIQNTKSNDYYLYTPGRSYFITQIRILLIYLRWIYEQQQQSNWLYFQLHINSVYGHGILYSHYTFFLYCVAFVFVLYGVFCSVYFYDCSILLRRFFRCTNTNTIIRVNHRKNMIELQIKFWDFRFLSSGVNFFDYLFETSTFAQIHIFTRESLKKIWFNLKNWNHFLCRFQCE